MELHKLKIYCTVVELKSFTKAAQYLRLSQPTVSEHIKSLERETDLRLLDRMGKKIVPTGGGHILYKYAKKIIGMEHKAEQALKSYSGRLAGKMSIGSGTIPGAYILPPYISQFKDSYPDISITLDIRGSKHITDKIISGKLELGIVGAKWDDSRLVWQQHSEDKIVLIAPPSHHWAKKKYIMPEELYNARFVIRDSSSGTRKAVANILQQQNVNYLDLDIIAEVGTAEAVRQSVKNNIGVAFISYLAVKDDIERGNLCQIALKGIEMMRHFYLVKHARRELSPLCATFMTEQLLKCGI